VKTDILHLPLDSNILVWFGHSSCYIQLHGKRILIDPVFSGNASPIPGSVKAFKGADSYSVDDLPMIDYLLISHDHYDHLDYETVLALKHKTKNVICGLGAGADFEFWGYPKERIFEKDWFEKITVDSGFAIFTESTRHQSGRGFTPDKTLWLSYVLQSPGQTIFISGDGGYDKHFADIGTKYGPIDLAIIENGQYDSAWHYVHLLPEETLKAARDVKAKRLLPVHNSKFMLGRHPWDEPLVKISEINKTYHIPLVTPMIGEVVNLNNPSQTFTEWWKGIR
jgi:L-ascorbate metabolism protein UlaG (beta-lactamase superfamily)